MHVIYHSIAFFMLVVLDSIAAVDVILCQFAISCTVYVLEMNQKILLPSDNYTARIRERVRERAKVYLYIWASGNGDDGLELCAFQLTLTPTAAARAHTAQNQRQQ